MELEIIKFVQGFANPVLDYFFTFITMAGEMLPIVAVVSWIYWNVDKEKGAKILYSLVFTICFGNGLKDIFKAPRPVGIPGVRTLREHTATGYSFPSGHTLSFAALASGLCLQHERKRGYYAKNINIFVPLFVLSLLVALSRVYLGVHYPKDVLAGLLIGWLLPVVLNLLYIGFFSKNLLFVLSLILLCPFLFFAHSADTFKVAGLYLGFTLGRIFEQKFVDYTTRAKMPVKILRYVLGAALLLGLQALTKAFFPKDLIFYALRYMIIAFVGLGLYPMFFNKFLN